MAKDDSPSLAAFEVGLRILTSACGPTPTFVLYPHPKSGCVIYASLNGSEASFRVPVTVEGLTEPIEIPTEYFALAIKGRKDGTLKVKGNSLVLTSGRFNATINSNEAKAAADIQIPEGDDVQHFVLTPELHQFFNVKLPQVKIERVHSALPDVMLNFRASAKSWYLATYDSQQMCFATVKAPADIGKFQILLPYTRFTTFIKDLPIANCKVYVNQNVLVATSPQFKVSIALPHFEEGTVVDPDAAFAKAKEFKEAAGKEFVISGEQLTAFLDSSRGFFSVGSEVRFSPLKGKSTEVSVVSAAGSAKMTVPGATVDSAFGLDFRFVQTLLAKQPKKRKAAEEDASDDTIAFEIVDDAFVLCKSAVIYAALMTASGEEDS